MKSFFLNIWSITIAIIILLLIGIWLLINKNIFAVEDALIKKYPTLNKKFDGNLLSSKSLIKNLENNYNVKFLPKTQFTNIKKKKLKSILKNILKKIFQEHFL